MTRMNNEKNALTNDQSGAPQAAGSIKVFCTLSDERVFRFLSPAMFKSGLRAAKINGYYVPFSVAAGEIGYAMKSLRVLNIAGANVTVPYKEAVVSFMDELSEGVQIIGSVNTIVIKDGMLKGYNTNAIGIMKALNGVGFKAAGKPVLVIGTGGAARSVVFLLKWLSAEPIFVAGRDLSKTRELVNRLGGEAVELKNVGGISPAVKLVVNATPVSDPKEDPALAEVIENMPLTKCDLVFDLNYHRPNNMWQALALQHNVRFMDGLASLGHQASHTLALWTGKKVEPRHFLAALKAS
jgi:shikimate dehydrogenase